MFRGSNGRSKSAKPHFDVVIDFAGVPGMEDQLITALCPRGRVLFIAGRDKVTYTFNLGQCREVRIKAEQPF